VVLLLAPLVATQAYLILVPPPPLLLVPLLLLTLLVPLPPLLLLVLGGLKEKQVPVLLPLPAPPHPVVTRCHRSHGVTGRAVTAGDPASRLLHAQPRKAPPGCWRVTGRHLVCCCQIPTPGS
jgi:hypothetical protein